MFHAPHFASSSLVAVILYPIKFILPISLVSLRIVTNENNVFQGLTETFSDLSANLIIIYYYYVMHIIQSIKIIEC